MMKILITGATGNIGLSTIKYIRKTALTECEIILGVRDIERAKKLFNDDTLEFCVFDFENKETYTSALKGVERVFLLRPPHISDVDKVFVPLLNEAKATGVKDVVFLSVQGADKHAFIPHAKIEKVIHRLGFNYIFLRPSYFMQNITSTLKKDVEEGVIKLPSGLAKFNWIDVDDIGRVAAITLINFSKYKNRVATITGEENISFADAVEIVNSATSGSLKYKSVNLIKFYMHKRQQGVSQAMIMVMIMLHYLPRFGAEPQISTDFELITGQKPRTLFEFAKDNMR